MPGYVKTDEELRNIRSLITPYRYTLNEVGIAFETTWDFARWVLPPCFEPVGDQAENLATGSASIFSPCQCPHAGDFDELCVALKAKYGEYCASWPLEVVVNTEAHLAWCKDVYGDTAKLGEARLYQDGDLHYGYGERRGVKLAEVEAKIDGAEQAPMSSSSYSFYLKMVPDSSCEGLEWPPRLSLYEGTAEFQSFREGSGTLSFGQSKWDPLHTIPLVSVGAAYAAQYRFTSSLLRQEDIADPSDEYAHYLWGRNFDDPTMEHITARWREQIAVND